MVTLDLREDLGSRVGTEVAVSEWIVVDQSMIDGFADVTLDRQWIHVDPERARRDTPFGGTIAHGLLTLSLLPALMQSSVLLENKRMGINAGFNRVRFTSPVKVGSRVRGRFTLEKLEAIDSGYQFTWKVTVEAENSEKPACVAEWVTRALV
jgi:acyl dehydratase